MNKNVIILGASGHAKVIADIIEKSNDNLIGFLDDNIDIQEKTIFLNKKVLGTIAKCKDYKECEFIIGIGNNNIRKEISNKYDLKWYTAIHPNAVIGNEVTVGEGTTIMAGTVINTGTKIGKHCIINTSSSIDHDNIIEDYVHISPGSHLAGNVFIGSLTWICAGVTIINNIKVNNNNIVGAGAVVLKDVLDTNKTIIGVPAKSKE